MLSANEMLLTGVYCCWCACRLPDGRLFDLIVSRPRFDEMQAAGFVVQVLSATQYLHNCRIAHLDLKVLLLPLQLFRLTVIFYIFVYHFLEGSMGEIPLESISPHHWGSPLYASQRISIYHVAVAGFAV